VQRASWPVSGIEPAWQGAAGIYPRRTGVSPPCGRDAVSARGRSHRRQGVRGAAAARRPGRAPAQDGEGCGPDRRRHHRIRRRHARSAGSHHSNPRHPNRSSSRHRPSSLSGFLPPVFLLCPLRSLPAPSTVHTIRLHIYRYRSRSLPDPVAAAPPHATSLRLGCPAQVYLAGRGRESAAQGADSLPRKPMRRAESRREAGRRRVGPLGPTPTDQRLETNTQKPTPRSDGAPVRGPVARDTRAQFTRLRAAIASQEGPPRTSWIRLPRPGIPGFGDDPVHSV
jgi:hypothetical protein